jgi:pimeloyl-ACP methyl ester carboxylesterase
MARPILMPQVGQDLTEGKVVTIKVKVGDKVKKGDIVAEVESEKATFDVEAFETGTIIEIRYKEGDTATVLQPLMMVGEEGEAPVSSNKAADSAPAQKNAPATAVAMASLHAVAGTGRSSPLARRLASEAGLDIRQLAGTGPGGAVVMKDVEAVRSQAPQAAKIPGFSPSTLAGSGIRSLQQGAGDPVLFVHGFGADLSAWRPFILNLGLGNPMLALDLPAHGINADTSAENFEAIVAAVHAGIAAAGLTRLHLVGHSLGAAVCATLAGGGDLDVGSLSLLSRAGLGPKVNGDYVEGFLSANSEAALKAWLGVLMHNPAMLPGALVRATMAARDGTNLAANQRKLAGGIFAGHTQLFSIRDAVQRFAGPVRAIVGGDDNIIPAEHVQTLPGHVAVHRLPQVGHLPQLEAAHLVARLVAQTVRSGG